MQLLWSFLTGVPDRVTSTFVADLGGKADAVTAARYLSPLPSVGAVVLVVGVFIMVAAFSLRIGVAGIVLTILGGFLVGLGWRGTIATLGPILGIGFLLYMVVFRLPVIVSIIGFIFSAFVLFWGLSVIWQGTGHKVPLFEGGRALILRNHGKDVDSGIFVAIGLVGTVLGLMLAYKSLRAIVRNWRDGGPNWLEDLVDGPGAGVSTPSSAPPDSYVLKDPNNPGLGGTRTVTDANGNVTRYDI